MLSDGKEISGIKNQAKETLKGKAAFSFLKVLLNVWPTLI